MEVSHIHSVILVRDMNDFAAGDDTDPPYIVAINVNDPSWLMVDFNERLDATTSQLITNYTINNNITVLGAYLYENTHVSLNISGMESGTHTLTVNGVEDELGNATVGEAFNFTYTATGIQAVSQKEFSIYPNPGNGQFLIEVDLSGDTPLHVQILDVTGKVVFENQFEATNGSNVIHVNEATISPGIYFIRISADNKVYMKKMVVE